MAYTGLVGVVTGGASGMGLSISKTLVGEGGFVVIADVQEALGQDVAAQFNAGKKEPVALFVKTDVTDWASTKNLFNKAVKTFGTVDIVWANAGVGGLGFPGPIDRDTSVIPPLAAIHVDLTAVVLTYQAALDIMRLKPDPASLPASEHEFRRKWRGKIIATSSQAGLYAHPSIPVYSAAKAGVIYLTHSTALLMIPEKITINAIAPGMVNTPLFQTFPDIISEAEAAGHATPMSTMMKAFFALIPADNATTGKVIEATQDTVAERAWVPYLDATTGKIWEDNFFPEHSRGFKFAKPQK